MPTYEYFCPSGHEFERLQRMTGPTRVRCPECGRVASRRISGGGGLIFKGSGFYITDYGKDGKGRSTESETEAKSETASKSGAPEPSAKPNETPARSDQPEKPAKKSSRKKASS